MDFQEWKLQKDEIGVEENGRGDKLHKVNAKLNTETTINDEYK